jgi:outer membrane protein
LLRPRRFIAVAAILLVSSAGARAQAAAQSAPPQLLTLEQALQYVVDHYPTVKAALELVNASVANVGVARTAYLPRFDALWQSNRATANNVFGQLLPQPVLPSISGPVLASTSTQTVWGSAAGGLFSWEPFDFGLRSATVHEAEAAVVRARAEERLTQLAAQNAVGFAFLGVVSAQQAVTSAEADVQRREVLSRVARTLADNQLRPGAEASRADAERAAAQTRAIQARQALIVAETTLAQVLGIADGPISVNTTRLLDDAAAMGPQSSAPLEHPLVQSGQAAVDLARAREVVLAKTDWPRLYLQSSVFARGTGANANGTFEGGTEGLGLERANWAAGVQVIFPNLFDFASLRARRTAAGALTRAERARYDEAVLTVTSRQRAADAVLAATRTIAQNTPIQLAAARQSETQARARYEAGLASIVEVADAQSLLAAAEYQNAVAHVDVWRALLAHAVAQGSLSSFMEQVRR